MNVILSLSLFADPPLADGGAPVTSYSIEMKQQEEGMWSGGGCGGGEDVEWGRVWRGEGVEGEGVEGGRVWRGGGCGVGKGVEGDQLQLTVHVCRWKGSFVYGVFSPSSFCLSSLPLSSLPLFSRSFLAQCCYSG